MQHESAAENRGARTKLGEEFNAGRVKVVVNVGCLTTGVDWDVRGVILARPTKSEMLYTQIIGRALRTADGKADALILDHSDTTLRLGFVDEIHHDRLDSGRPNEATAKTKSESQKLPRECTACHFVKAAGVHVCPVCGFAPERREEVEVAAGELVQLRGRKVEADGWASHKYRERFGVWPQGLRAVPAQPDVQCANFVRASQIRFAKGRGEVLEGRGARPCMTSSP